MYRMLIVAGLLAGCTPDEEPEPEASEQDVALRFVATVGDEVATCGTSYDLGIGAVATELADARLFLSAIELKNAAGDWVPLSLDDTDWQTDGVALLDFEDGTAGCADSGTAEMNDTLTGAVAEGTYEAVRFDVGIPFELNHVDSASAPPPFNSPGMFWVWQGGYKFVRIDFTNGAGRWNVHVGSTACVSDGATVPPDEPCGRPNISTVELAIDPLTDEVDIDLAALVAEADIEVNSVDTPPGCQSMPTEPDDCAPVFETLGIDFDSGACIADCAEQTVFSGAAR